MKNFPTPHSHQRSLDSASTPEAFAERELELNTGYLCNTDHGTLAASREVFSVAQKRKLTPIIGLEGYLRDDENDPILTKFGITGEAVKKYVKYMHCTMHFQDEESYNVAVKCISDADLRAEKHGSESKPLFTWAQMEQMCSKNTTLASSCLVGLIGRHILAGRKDIAEAYYQAIRSLPKKGNFYCEVMPHDCSKKWVNGVIMQLEDGRKVTYWLGKKFRTNKHPDEITAADLCKEVAKHGSRKIKITEVKNGHKWAEMEPVAIIEAKVVQDFIENECLPGETTTDVQLVLNKAIIELANKYGDPLIPSDDSHYAYPQDKEVQNIRLLNMGGGLNFYKSYHRYSSQEAFDHFHNTLGISEKTFEGWVDNSYEWASKFHQFSFTKQISLPVSFYPKDTMGYLNDLIQKNGRMDWNDNKKVERLKYEINLLKNNGVVDLLPYFFLGEDVCDKYVEAEQLTGVGRGSSAGLLLTYLLGITHVDPLKYDLSVDRFITKERIQSGRLPDIDQDLCDRTLLVGEDGNGGYLKERFGPNFAQISTDIMLKLKSAIKDVYRARQGSVSKEIDDICKKIPQTPQGIEDKDFVFGYEDSDGNHIDGLVEKPEGEVLRYYIKKYPHDWSLVLRLLKINRAKSRHASSYVISDKPVDSFIPLTTVGGVRVTQYTAKAAEDAGALKMDYLVVNSLKDIQECIRLVQEKDAPNLATIKSITLNSKKVPKLRAVPFNGELYDIWDLPLDEAVFDDICEGKTETVFQLNTNSAIRWLKEFNHLHDGKKLINSIADISAFIALDRPGPLNASVEDENGQKVNMLQEFARRKRNQSKATRMPILDEICKDTQGIIIYQESLQKIFQNLGNATPFEANSFREKIAHKKMEEVLNSKPLFMKGAVPKIGEYEASQIWDMMVTFGEYGFCHAHSISYAYTAYACAFLKHYFPIQWWCSVLRHADKNEIGEIFWPYCGHFIDMPDVNKSGDNFTIVGNRIRAPIGFLLGVGESAHKELCANRPYKSIEDFCTSIYQTKVGKTTTNEEGKVRKGLSALNSGVVTKLILSGAMDSLFPDNYDVFAKIDAYYKASSVAEGKRKPQTADPKFLNLNSFQLFQMKKKILSVFSEPLKDKIPNLNLTEIKCSPIMSNGEKIKDIYSYYWETKRGTEDYLFVSSQDFRKINESDLAPCPCNVAMIGYVLSSRTFMWEGNLNLELVLDVNGEPFKFVKWADRRTGKPNLPMYDLAGQNISLSLPSLEGSVIIALLSKWNYGKPFNLSAIRMIQEPLEE